LDGSPDPTRGRSFSSAVSEASASWAPAGSAPPRPIPRAPPRRNPSSSSFNCGGPSHIDLWDPKPDATEEVRGVFRPISTNVSGIRVSELLPRAAKLMDKCSIIRSVHHSHQGHNSAMYWSIVGRPYPIDSTLINPSRTDLPSLGTLVGWLAQRDHYSGSLPPYVITPAPHCDSTAYITPGQYGGCLGARHDPFVLQRRPQRRRLHIRDISPVDGITPRGWKRRQSLLREIEGGTVPIDTASRARSRSTRRRRCRSSPRARCRRRST